MQHWHPENLLKGRLAESLVEELLKRCDNIVYRFGYEAVLQNLTQIEKTLNRESEVSQRIRSIPDFIVINSENKPFFVEVKFRSTLTMYKEDLQRIALIKKFWKAKIILLTLEKPYFRISVFPYLDKQKEWKWLPLEKDEDLNVKLKVLEEFNEVFEKYTSVLRQELNP